MPKLPTIDSKGIIKILEQNSFSLRRVSGSHQIYFNEINKKRVIVLFHNKDLPKGTLNAILKDAGIDRMDLLK